MHFLNAHFSIIFFNLLKKSIYSFPHSYKFGLEVLLTTKSQIVKEGERKKYKKMRVRETDEDCNCWKAISHLSSINLNWVFFTGPQHSPLLCSCLFGTWEMFLAIWQFTMIVNLCLENKNRHRRRFLSVLPNFSCDFWAAIYYRCSDAVGDIGVAFQL